MNLFCCLSLVICRWLFNAAMFCSCSNMTCFLNLQKSKCLNLAISHLNNKEINFNKKLNFLFQTDDWWQEVPAIWDYVWDWFGVVSHCTMGLLKGGCVFFYWIFLNLIPRDSLPFLRESPWGRGKISGETGHKSSPKTIPQCSSTQHRPSLKVN